MSETLVRARERRAKRESSLVVGVADISWTAISYLVLTARRQLAKSQVPNSTCHWLTRVAQRARKHMFPEPSQKVSRFLRETGRER